MPVVPIFAAIGTALGASAGSAAAVGAVTTVAVGSTVASAGISAISASKQASVAAAVADYNAKVDIANAKQLQLDAAANVERQRTRDRSYLSKVRTAYAASGIRSGSGTPMEVLATTAGRQENDIQNYWRSVNQKTDRYYGAAEEGIAEGHEMADIYHLKAAGDVLSGVGKVAGMFAGASLAKGGGGTGGGDGYSGDSPDLG